MPEFGCLLSHYQGIPDFSLMAKAGITFVNVKASEGVSMRDARYEYNVREARRLGMHVIAFHFYRPGDWLGNISNFLKATSLYPPDLYEIDFEVHGRNPTTTLTEITEIAHGLLEDTKQRPVLYLNPNFGNIYSYYGLNKLHYCLLHIAHYKVGFPGQIPSFVKWYFWQYVKSGRVNGIHGSTSLEYSLYPFTYALDMSRTEVLNG
jgi:lysozyme